MAMENIELRAKSFEAIEKQLDKLVESSYSDLGLYTGKAGLAIAYFLLAKVYNHATNTEKGEQLLIDIMRNINIINNTNFTTGLKGIGWSIEFISQRNFIKVNTDKVLYDFDDLLFKQVSCFKSKSLALEDGLLGTAYYFYSRILAQNERNHPYRQILNDRCLIFLIDEIKEFIYEDKTFNSKINIEFIDDKTLGQTIMFLYLCLKKGINIEACRKMIWDLRFYIDNEILPENIVCLKYPYVLYAYAQIAKYTNDRDMLQSIKMFDSLNDTNLKLQIDKDYNLTSKSPLSIIYNIDKLLNTDLWNVFYLLSPNIS